MDLTPDHSDEHDDLPALVVELAQVKLDLAAAEQRACNAEESLERAGSTIASLTADLTDARFAAAQSSGILPEDVRAYLRAVDVFVSAGSSGAVAAWRDLKAARAKLDQAIAKAEET